MDLQLEIEKKLHDLDISVKELRKTGSQYAESYTSYRIAVAKELMLLRDNGVPVTIAYDIARGKPEIAKLKFNEIRDEAIYKANLESINATKLEIKILNEQLQREWTNIQDE